MKIAPLSPEEGVDSPLLFACLFVWRTLRVVRVFLVQQARLRASLCIIKSQGLVKIRVGWQYPKGKIEGALNVKLSKNNWYGTLLLHGLLLSSWG